ncbi:hypothetical protein HG452_001875 [Candidatus Saccharibacteria bacterium]|nr:hypothetical protein [Candidatus Saccharibacteria bacterium]
MCETDNIEQIAESISKILDNKQLAADFSKNGLEIIKQHDLNFTISKFEEIYNFVIEKKKQEPRNWLEKLSRKLKK